jgi:putative glycerol-1-phosphate prenyltransferase
MNSDKMSVLSTIQHHQQSAKPLLAVLVDPDKRDRYSALLPYLREVDLVLVGGSTGTQIEECVALLRQHTSAPLVLFPGNTAQFTQMADALLFLTLLNSRRAEVLIEPHVQSAITIRQSGIETIPMGYILVDGDRQSAVERVSGCTPIARQAVTDVVSHAVAGQLLGKQLIYIEAGSGAKTPVSIDTVRAVRQAIDVPLIVGGGITTEQQMLLVFSAGANIVVVGNHFEQHPEDLPRFLQAKQSYVHTN